MKLAEVPIILIEIGERFREDYGNLSELIQSIKDRGGLIQPVALYEKQSNLTDMPFLLLAGGRRMRAVIEAGIKSVPALIYDHPLTELEIRSIELAENIYRKDLTWLEKAKLCREIYNLQVEIHGIKLSTSPGALGTSKRDIASMLGRSPASVVQDILLADAIDNIPELAECKTADEARKLIAALNKRMDAKDISEKIMAERANTPEEVMQRGLINAYIVGDFFENSKALPNNWAHIAEIDPPYGISLQKIKREATTLSVEDYNEVDEKDYPIFILNMLRESYRILADNGWLILWHGSEWMQTVFDIAIKVGFVGKAMPGIWAKGTPGQTMHPEIYLGSAYEPFLYLRKSPDAKIYKPGRSNVFSYSPINPQLKIHPTERPIELIEDILRTFVPVGSNVLVPFLGSGNTILAAHSVGMKAIGYDLNERYKGSFIIKVKATSRIYSKED